MKRKICRSCFKVLDANTPVGDERGPEAGDFSICFYCGTVCTFDKDMNLIPYPDEEFHKLAIIDPVNYSILCRAAAQIRNRILAN